MEGQDSRVNCPAFASPKDVIVQIDQDGQEEAFRTSPREDFGLMLARHQHEGLIQDIMNAAIVGPHFLEQKLLTLYKSGDLDDGQSFPVPLF